MANIATRLPGPYVYLDIVAQGASFGIYINGEEQNIKTSSMLNCSYDQSGTLLTRSLTNNITVCRWPLELCQGCWILGCGLVVRI
jgi:hypothetical protein